MTSTASIRTTVHIEKTSRVRINVAEEGTGLAHMTIGTGDLTLAIALCGKPLDDLIEDLKAIQANAHASEPILVESLAPRTRLDDVIDRIRVA